MKTSKSVLEQDQSRGTIYFVSNNYNPNAPAEDLAYPASEKIPAEDEIYVEEVNDKGEIVGKKVKIRYVPGEPSIFADEQSEQAQDRRRLGVIKLNYGHLGIHYMERAMLEYCRLTDYNGAKPRRDTKKNILFYEDIPGKKGEKFVSDDRLVTEVKWKIHNMNKTSLETHAMVLGIPYKNKITEDLKQDLIVYAQRNPESFNEISGKPEMTKKHRVLRAIEEGVLEINDNSNIISWKQSGKDILRAPISSDATDYFVEYLSKEAGLEVYEEICRVLGIDEDADLPESIKRKAAEIENPSTPEPKTATLDADPLAPVFPAKPSSDPYKLAEQAEKAYVIIKAKTGPWYHIKGEKVTDKYYNFAKGRKNIVKAIKSDDELKAKITSMLQPEPVAV